VNTPLRNWTSSHPHRLDPRSTRLPPVIKPAVGWTATIVIVERTRRLWNKTTHEVQFYLSTLPPTVLKLPPPFASIGALKTAALDLGCHLGEDACRVRSLTRQFVFITFAVNALNRVAGKQSQAEVSAQQWMSASCCGYAQRHCDPAKTPPLAVNSF